MIKVLNVVGARPNFVKIAPLLARMREHAGIRPILVHTGQHSSRDMVDCFWQDLRIPRPDFVLSGDAARRELAMTQALAQIMGFERPDVVLVVGDVNSTVAAAVAATELGIPIAHVEAGLRSFDITMPEEVNRIITDGVSTLWFASEPSAVCNLMAEGYLPERVFFVGNVMIDSLRQCLPLAQRSAALRRLGLVGHKYALATLHRPATVDDREVLRQVWPALESIAARVPLVFPVHPRTQARLRQFGLERRSLRQARRRGVILMIPPLPYLEFLHLESKACLVLTDSGGVQEETTAMGVACLTLRNNTERHITVTQGTNQIVGLDPVRIVNAAHEILAGRAKQGRIPQLWDGHAAERIVNVLRKHFGAPEHAPQLAPPQASQRTAPRIAQSRDPLCLPN
ncbi:MAG TPA: UDP-N-acetylglucosamine 2-epimerase (non-hydrolyzing) [Terriglobia bacterium]|nr:UDP-N-acetylglucosamine 2-epimerase (non-hydrolyzing) [Terriglobia bacterium]